MNRRDYLHQEAIGVSLRGYDEYTNMDEDDVESIRQEIMRKKRRRRNLSCTDGFCGAEDCCRCRPGSYRFLTEED